jgi:hypothetical protein
MPFDFDAAKKDGISDEAIQDHLQSLYPDFDISRAKKDGVSLKQISDHLTTKGGENYGKQNQPQGKLDNGPSRQAQEYGEVGSGEGPQPSEMRVRQPSGGEERFGSVNARESRSYVPKVLKGGEVTSEEDAKTKSQRAQEGEEDGQGLRGEVDARKQAEVRVGGVRPSPTESATIAGLGSLAEASAQLAGMHYTTQATAKYLARRAAIKAAGRAIAMGLAAPIAGAEEVASAGLATPLAVATEIGAGLAGGWVADKLEQGLERILGVHDTIERAKEENPMLSEVIGTAAMAPLAVKSVGNLIKLGATKGAGAVGKAVAGGAAAGAGFYPIQVGFDNAINYLTDSKQHEDLSLKGFLMGAATGGALGGLGLPETGKVLQKKAVGDAAREKLKTDSIDPHDEVEEAYRLAEDHVTAGNRTEASLSLNYAKDLEKNFPVDENTQKNRDARYAFLDHQIEGLEMGGEMKPLPERRKLPSEMEEKPPAEEVTTAGDGEKPKPKWSNEENLDDLSREYWAEHDRLKEEKRRTNGTPAFRAARAAYEAHNDRIMQGGDLRGKIIDRGTDLNNFEVTAWTNPEAGLDPKNLSYKVDLKGATWTGEYYRDPKNGQRYRKVRLANGEEHWVDSQRIAKHVSDQVKQAGKEPPTEPAQVVGHKVVPRKEGEKFVYDVVQVLRDKAGNETTGEQIDTGVSKSKAEASRREADKKSGVAKARPSKYDSFAKELPVSKYIFENGRLESFTEAKRRVKKEGGDINKLTDLYKGAQQYGRNLFADSTHNKVYGGTKTPDILAQDLYEAGHIDQPTPDALWEKLREESFSAKRTQEQEVKRNQWENKQIRDYERQQKRESRQQIREGKRLLKRLEKKTDEASKAKAQKLREEIAQAEAELKPAKPSEKTAETEEPKTSGILDVEGEPSVVKTEGEAEGGTPPGFGEGEEKEVKGTKLLSAAYRRPSDGKIFYAKNHITAMREAGVAEEHIPTERTGREDSRFGFRTDTHEFVTRDEAEAVARKHGHLLDEEGFNAAVAENEYHKLHSTDVRLADHAEYENPLITEEKLGPGASKAKELDIESEKRDFIRAASLHQINPDLSNSFAKWWSAFKEIASKEDLKRINKFTQEKRHALFEQGRALLEYANQFGKGLGLAVEDSKKWWNKTAKQIKDAEQKRKVEPIRMDFDAMDEMLKRMGFEGLGEREKVSQEENYKEAVRRMTNPEDPDYTAKLIESLQSNLRPIDTVEKFVLQLEKIRRENEINELYKEAKKQKEGIRRDNLMFKARQLEFEAQKLIELTRRSISEGARSLQASQAFTDRDMSFVSMKTAIEAILGRDISESMREKFQGWADRWKSLGKDLNEASQKARDNRFKDSTKEIFEAATREERERKGKPARTPAEQVSDFTARIKGAKGDPAELGQAIRGLFKALHKRDKTKDAEKLTEATNAIVKKYMGKDWDISETKKAIEASGQYYQMTMEAAFAKAKSLPKKVAAILKEVELAKKVKDDSVRRKRIADALKKNNIEVRDAYADLKDHFDAALSEAQKMMADIEHQQRECS